MTIVDITGRVHDLKCWPDHFEALVDGRKTFEVRINDRDYQVGDVLALQEWDPLAERYTGRGERAVVTYIYRGNALDVPVGISPYVQEGLDGRNPGSEPPVVVLGLSLGGIEV